ncbi:MAG: hypothetical protein UDM11_01060, partial [Oscillospiraceae bacterium]|nr:hypothetical protein [Oscillospiraceae bacterium]
SLAEFAARRRQIKWNHFLPGRVPGKKYFSVCKCGICSLSVNKLCARQTASLLSKRASPFFDNSVLYTFFPEKTTWQKFAFTPYAKPEK